MNERLSIKTDGHNEVKDIIDSVAAVIYVADMKGGICVILFNTLRAQLPL